VLEDGFHRVYYRGVDRVGNWSARKKKKFWSDTEKPEVSFSGYVATERGNFVGWWRSVKVSGEDKGSGIAWLNYRINEGDWVKIGRRYYEVDLSKYREGEEIKVSAYAVDKAGNRSEVKTEEVILDNTPPAS
jgi:hypothetical protein